MDKPIALIFGSNGQDGFYLNALLKNLYIQVINISRKNADVCGSVSNYEFVENLVKTNQPNYIFHFAANSSARHDLLFENHETICTGTLNILECVKLHSPHSKVFISGSALQFKNIGLPIDEFTEFEASSPYSIARIQSVYAARYYRKAFGLKVYVGYFFNHDSPLRTEHHVNQKIVKAAQRISSGSNEKLVLGNVDVCKEFSYAADVVEAVWTLVNQDNIFETIIGSGKSYSIKDWVKYCFEIVNLNYENYVEVKEDYIPEYKTLVSNPALLMSLGWQPKTDFYQLANMMMNEY